MARKRFILGFILSLVVIVFSWPVVQQAQASCGAVSCFVVIGSQQQVPSAGLLTVNAIYDRESEGIALVIRNHGSSAEKVSVFDAYSGKTRRYLLYRHNSVTYVSRLEESFGWYDLTVRVDSDARFRRQLAGHVETGRPSVTDPAIGGGVRETAEVGDHD